MLFDIHKNKSRYLNKHIPKDIHSKDISNSTSRQCTPTVQKDCYQCALPLTPGHMENCEGLLATCRHCGTKGHIKDACGKLGYFPESHYKA